MPLPCSPTLKEIPLLEKEIQEGKLAKDLFMQLSEKVTRGGGICQQQLFGPQKRRWPETGNKRVSNILRYEQFMMEGIHMLRDLLKIK